jgi:hypothetical protein
MTAAPAISQRWLKLKVPIHAPLIGMILAMGILQLRREQVMELIDVERTLLAWDIGVGAHRNEIRLLAKSVDDARRRADGEPMDLLTRDQALAIILARENKPTIANPDFQIIFGCERKLMIDLIEDGELIACGSWRKGRGGEAHATKASVIQFLKRRAL